jgi:DNA-binding IclR family transcriptional regulator
LKEAMQMAHAVDDKGAVARTGGGVRPLSSALKTLALLDLLGDSDQPLSLAEMTRAAGESRATIYQKLVTLVHAGWIEQTDQGSYRLSLHAARMSDAALKQASLGERSTAILQELVHEVGETASLAVLSDVHARLVKRIEAEVMVRADVRVGTLLSLDNSSSGRVLTAFATPELRARLQHNGGVLASAALLREVVRKGHAISSGKDKPGVQSIAVPIFDANGACVSALSIVAPVERFGGTRYLRPLLRAGEKLNALMVGAPAAALPPRKKRAGPR